jgi:hypothetical protein
VRIFKDKKKRAAKLATRQESNLIVCNLLLSFALMLSLRLCVRLTTLIIRMSLPTARVRLGLGL